MPLPPSFSSLRHTRSFPSPFFLPLAHTITQLTRARRRSDGGGAAGEGPAQTGSLAQIRNPPGFFLIRRTGDDVTVGRLSDWDTLYGHVTDGGLETGTGAVLRRLFLCMQYRMKRRVNTRGV